MATEKPNLIEIATTRNGRDITRGYVDGLKTLPPQDPILQQHGYDYYLYERLLQDDQVSACLAQRRMAVVACPWGVKPGGPSRLDKKAAELVQKTLNCFDWDKITDQMLYARLFGFAAAELIWDIKDSQVVLTDIRVRNQRRFAFAPDNSLRLLTIQKPDGEELPPKSFWHLSVGSHHHDEPYGRGLGSTLYWPVFFKRNGAKFWATFLEKFGMPTGLGKFPNGASQTEKNILLQALQALASEAGVIIPENMAIELIEAKRSGNGTYDIWMAYWDAAIAKIILGQTMTTSDGSSYAQATVHYEVRQDIIQADADLVCQSANNTWIKWLVDYNLPGAAYPQIWRDLEEAEDLAQRAQRDQTLHGMGYKLKPEAVTEIYGDEYEPVQPAAPVSEPASAPKPKEENPTSLKKPIGFYFAESDGYIDPIAPMAETLERETNQAWKGIFDHIQKMVAQTPDLPTLKDQLLNAYGDLPTDELTKVMSMAFAASELVGWYDSSTESDG